MLRNNPMSASISLRPQIARKFPSRSRVERPFHPSSTPLSPQTPSLPDADPRSDRFRCGGRESKFLAADEHSVAKSFGDNVIHADLSLNNPKEFKSGKEMNKFIDSHDSPEEARDELIKQGFDGIKVARSEFDGEIQSVAVVFDKKQIKITNRDSKLHDKPSVKRVDAREAASARRR